jgi:hypothetical protein
MINKEQYINILNKLDRKHDGGIAYLSEDDTFRALIPELKLGDGNFETPYRNILEHNNLKWEHKFNSPRVDYENHIKKVLIEFKTLNKQYPRGKIDEYTAKKLFDDAARHSFINPFPLSEQGSVASQSVIGDIEKLLMLPSDYTRLSILHFWDNEVYSAETHLKMLDYMVNQYYDVDTWKFEYTDSVNEMSTRCHVRIFKINAKKS